MRELDVKEITEAIAGLSKETNVSLSEDVKSRICMMRMKETDEGAKSILETIEKNIKIAGEEDIPLKEDETTNPVSEEGIQAQAEGEENSKPSGDQKGQWAICPVCGNRFIKKESNQVYDSIACANRGRRSTPRYGG